LGELLGHHVHLKKAEDFIKAIIAKQVLEVEPKDIAGYVLPSNIYVVDWQVGSQSKYPTCETWWRCEEISEGLPP
jgi:hypothetical protein